MGRSSHWPRCFPELFPLYDSVIPAMAKRPFQPSLAMELLDTSVCNKKGQAELSSMPSLYVPDIKQKKKSNCPPCAPRKKQKQIMSEKEKILFKVRANVELSVVMQK
jgi:hypothetical protein